MENTALFPAPCTLDRANERLEGMLVEGVTATPDGDFAWRVSVGDRYFGRLTMDPVGFFGGHEAFTEDDEFFPGQPADTERGKWAVDHADGESHYWNCDDDAIVGFFQKSFNSFTLAK